jgi:hypothetical protein
MIFVGIFGCSESHAPRDSNRTFAVDNGQYEPCEVILSDGEVTLPEPGVAKFEVKYKFIKGKAARYYSCDISFPGTMARATKRMEAWQVNDEGVIVDRLAVPKEGVDKFEIVFMEAPTGMAPYAPVSNVLQGQINR